MKSIIKKMFQTGIVFFLLIFSIVALPFIAKEKSGINKSETLEQKLFAGEIYLLRLSSDGKYYYTCDNDNTLKKWDSETGVLLKEDTIQFNGKELNFLPDGKLIVTRKNSNNKSYVSNTLIYDTLVVFE